MDPLYVDTIIRRWQALTGDTARHAVSGMSFDDTINAALGATAVTQEDTHGS